MNRIRLWLALIIAWLFFIYKIEDVSEPMNIASFVYVYIAIVGISMIVLPTFYHGPSYWPFLLSLPPYFFFKWYFGYQIGGKHLPITVTEITAIGITIFLVGRFLRDLSDVQETILTITTNHLKKVDDKFEKGQGRLYREIRRARQLKRPATLLTIQVIKESVNLSLNRFILEAQQSFINWIIDARVADLLIDQLKESDVVTQRNEEFVVLLPETSGQNAEIVVTKLKKAAKEKLGLDIEIGKSCFPDQAITLSEMLEDAEIEPTQPTVLQKEQTEAASDKQETGPGIVSLS
jgi:hypothetical protein